ncbi:SH3 domain-containing protein [Ahrensia marina]|uniref:SH3 domain-containing protein n=1 Tax=Ahrensia marina TaxID=1514904 RepID=UPI0009E6CD08
MGKASSKTGWFVIGALIVGYLIGDGDDATESPANRAPVTQAPQIQETVSYPVPKSIPNRQAPTPDTKRSVPVPKVSVEPSQSLSVTTTLNVRSRPTTDSKIVGKLAAGTRILVASRDGAWRQIQMPSNFRNAWVHGDYLTERALGVPKPQSLISTPRPKAKVARSGAGTPVRSPRTGSCDCPYDRMRNGARCGGRSAWSRPGGRSPICFN